MSAQSAIARFTRVVTAAAGVFAPGHLGELTPLVPFELVDDLLSQTGTVQRRLRDLPSRVGMYFVLALGLFPGIGYLKVWDKMTAALDDLGLARPSEKALRDLRRRLGPAPLKALFEVLAGPLAWPYMPGVRFMGLRTVAFDGCSSLRVADSVRNRAWLGRVRHRLGFAGYPLPHLMTLAETGTRGLLGAVVAAAADGDETALASQLLHLLRRGMLVLMDRGFDAGEFLAAVAATGADFLVRAKASRSPLVLDVLPDGSYITEISGLRLRIIEARVAVTGAGGSRAGDSYRLITTLLDHRRYPAARLVQLYHERWEIESAYYALRCTLLHGRVLRSQDRPGLEQEIWGLLALYQLLRMAMTDAAAAIPGTDPDRASFTTALETARDQLTAAQGIIPGPDQPGAITRAVQAALLPARRPRYSARKVKSSTSRYPGRDDDPRPALPEVITNVDITIITPPPPGTRARPAARKHRSSAPATRRHQVTALMTTDPRRAWTAAELATRLCLPARDLLTQLGRWARAGLLTRAGPATYTLTAPPQTPGKPP